MVSNKATVTKVSHCFSLTSLGSQGWNLRSIVVVKLPVFLSTRLAAFFAQQRTILSWFFSLLVHCAHYATKIGKKSASQHDFHLAVNFFCFLGDWWFWALPLWRLKLGLWIVNLGLITNSTWSSFCCSATNLEIHFGDFLCIYKSFVKIERTNPLLTDPFWVIDTYLLWYAIFLLVYT